MDEMSNMLGVRWKRIGGIEEKYLLQVYASVILLRLR